MRKLVGMLLISSPFIGLFIWGTIEIGVLKTIFTYLFCGLLIIVVSTGTHFLYG